MIADWPVPGVVACYLAKGSFMAWLLRWWLLLAFIWMEREVMRQRWKWSKGCTLGDVGHGHMAWIRWFPLAWYGVVHGVCSGLERETRLGTSLLQCGDSAVIEEMMDCLCRSAVLAHSIVFVLAVGRAVPLQGQGEAHGLPAVFRDGQTVAIHYSWDGDMFTVLEPQWELMSNILVKGSHHSGRAMRSVTYSRGTVVGWWEHWWCSMQYHLTTRPTVLADLLPSGNFGF